MDAEEEEELIRTQGYDVCRACMTAVYIHNVSSFGVARITPRDVTGARHTRGAKGTGRLLIEIARQRLIDRGAARVLRLFSLPDARLRAYYRDIGFREKQVGPPGSNLKLYEMLMDLE